jgi:hypothetical protein
MELLLAVLNLAWLVGVVIFCWRLWQVVAQVPAWQKRQIDLLEQCRRCLTTMISASAAQATRQDADGEDLDEMLAKRLGQPTQGKKS